MTLVARVTFLVLLGATFAAFFVAQRLKSAPPAIRVKGLAVLFSPNGDGRRDRVRFSMLFKKAGRVTAEGTIGSLTSSPRLAEAYFGSV